MKTDQSNRDFINNLKQLYQAKITQLGSETVYAVKSREGIIDVMKKHHDLMILVINSLLDYIAFPDDMELMISGSFVKGTNLLDSDLDLTFVYPDKKRDICYPLEKQLINCITEVTCNPWLKIHSPVTLPAGQVIWDQLVISSIRNKKDLRRYFLKIKKRINLKLCSIFNTGRLPIFELSEFGNGTERFDAFYTAIKKDFVLYKFDDSDKLNSINSLLFSAEYNDLLDFLKLKKINLSKTQLDKLQNSMANNPVINTNGRLLIIRNVIELAYPELAPKYIVKFLKSFISDKLLSEKIKKNIKNQTIPVITKNVIRLPQSIEKWNDRGIESVILYFSNNMCNREWLIGGDILKLSSSEFNLQKVINDILLLERNYILDKHYIADLETICNKIRMIQQEILPGFINCRKIKYAELSIILEKYGHKLGYYLLFVIKSILIHKYNTSISERSYFDMLNNQEIYGYIGKTKCKLLYDISVKFLNLISAIHIQMTDKYGYNDGNKNRLILNNDLVYQIGVRFNYGFSGIDSFKEYINSITLELHNILIDITKDITDNESIHINEISYRRAIGVLK